MIEQSPCYNIAFLGRTNVGKSSLFNKLAQSKTWSAVSPKRHTTQQFFISSLSEGPESCALIDGPGTVSKRDTDRHQTLQTFTTRALSNAATSHLILFVTEAAIWGSEEEALLESLELQKLSGDVPIFWILNKVDLVKEKNQLLSLVAHITKKFNFKEVLFTSVSKNQGIETLKQLIFKEFFNLKNNFFDTTNKTERLNQGTDPSLETLFQESVKEEIYCHTHQELPYICKVEITKLEVDAKNPDSIRYVAYLDLLVPKVAHRKMLIGVKGITLGKIRASAEMKLQKRLKGWVKLKLWVKLKDHALSLKGV